MIQVSILRRDLPGNGQRILPQDSTPTNPSNPSLEQPTPHPTSSDPRCVSLFQPSATASLPLAWKLLSDDSTSNADRCTLSSLEDDIRRN